MKTFFLYHCRRRSTTPACIYRGSVDTFFWQTAGSTAKNAIAAIAIIKLEFFRKLF